MREWLLCDLLIFLLVLAFLNLRGVAKPEAYAGSFWDLLNVVLFFIAFWVIDRTAVRGRFLLGYGYLVVLPVLLLIWQSVAGRCRGRRPGGPRCGRSSSWPACSSFLRPSRSFHPTGERQALPAVKDALFVVLYAVLLIVAAKSA